MVIGGFIVYMFYPTQSRIASKWNQKIISLEVQIDAKRSQRVKAKEDYLKLDSTLSGTIVDLKSQVERYTACLNNLSLNCESASMIPQVSAAESTTWTVASASSEVPLWTWDQGLQIDKECELGIRTDKVQWIEFHYTASTDTKLSSIKASHEAKYGIDHIGYHYVIKSNGEITSTRDEKCIAAADKWEKNNYRFIQVAFIWDDKPTDAQTKAMVELSKAIQFRYKLPIDSVSSHQEWGPKSAKENFIHWYWSKAEFVKKIRQSQTITLHWKTMPELTYIWEAWGDLDVIATWYQESWLRHVSVWDGWQSVWYCQIHWWFNPGWQAKYRALKTMEERLNYCHELYVYASTLPGWVGSRFHWYNARLKHIPFISIK
jgi:hypothetical protein